MLPLRIKIKSNPLSMHHVSDNFSPSTNGPARDQTVLPAGLPLAALAGPLLIQVGQSVLLDGWQCCLLWQVRWLGLASNSEGKGIHSVTIKAGHKPAELGVKVFER